MRRVTCLGGSDGIHLHCTEGALIEDCLMETGDDCVAGLNIRDLTVRRCVLNSSCNPFRIGGIGILVEDTYVWGPGFYPHRRTVVKGKGEELPRTEGRHNTLSFVEYFTSPAYPFPPSDVTIRRCVIENVACLLSYQADSSILQRGTYLGTFTLEDVTVRGLEKVTVPRATAEVPLTIRMKRTSVEFSDGSRGCPFETPEGAYVRLLCE